MKYLLDAIDTEKNEHHTIVFDVYPYDDRDMMRNDFRVKLANMLLELKELDATDPFGIPSTSITEIFEKYGVEVCKGELPMPPTPSEDYV